MHPSWLYGPTPLSLHKAEAIHVQKQNKCSAKMNRHPKIHLNPPSRQLARWVSFIHWPIAVFASWNVQFSKTCHSRGFHIVVHWSLVTPKAHFFAPLAKPLWFNHTHLEPGSSAGWLAVGCVNQWCFPSIQRVAKIRENEMMTVKAVWPTPNTRASRGAMSFPATRYTAATAALVMTPPVSEARKPTLMSTSVMSRPLLWRCNVTHISRPTALWTNREENRHHRNTQYHISVKCCRVGTVPWTHRLSTCCTDRLME